MSTAPNTVRVPAKRIVRNIPSKIPRRVNWFAWLGPSEQVRSVFCSWLPSHYLPVRIHIFSHPQLVVKLNWYDGRNRAPRLNTTSLFRFVWNHRISVGEKRLSSSEFVAIGQIAVRFNYRLTRLVRANTRVCFFFCREKFGGKSYRRNYVRIVCFLSAIRYIHCLLGLAWMIRFIYT